MGLPLTKPCCSLRWIFLSKLVQEGKKNGSIRKDIDDNILSMFLIGASMKIQENILNKARNTGTDIIYKGFEIYKRDIRAMMKLLKNGMGGEKSCL